MKHYIYDAHYTCNVMLNVYTCTRSTTDLSPFHVIAIINNTVESLLYDHPQNHIGVVV